MGMPTTPGIHGNPRMAAERTSIYSATGVGPAISGDRNSYYAKQGDAASVRSGLLGHGRAESVSGSIGGLSSPLITPREVFNEKSENEKEDTPVASRTKEA
jgi:hypothetical protein